MIADLGLSELADQEPIKNCWGIAIYCTRGIKWKTLHTQKSDIYRFGISISSTGQQLFRNFPHDPSFAFKVCEGSRPAFSNNTPNFYIELAYKCMDANPDNRPTADG